MKKEKIRRDEATVLRQKAEKKLSTVKAAEANLPELTEIDLKKTIHELEVHQIELEMQNDELQQAQGKLEESKKRYFDLFDFAPIGYLSLDKQGKILELNLTAAKMLGHARRSLINTFFHKHIINSYQDSYYLHQKKYWKTKSEQSCEMILQKKDKSEFWGQLISLPFFNTDNNLIDCRTAIIDISDRKKAETELRKRELQYRSFVNNFHGIAFASFMNWTPIYFHGAVKEITGYEEKDFISGTPRWDQIIHPDDIENLANHESKAGIDSPGYHSQREYRIIVKSGKVRWVHDYIHTVYDETSEQNILQGALYDISERKQTEIKLSESEKKYRTLVNEVNDGFYTTDLYGCFTFVNNALAHILGFSQPEELVGLNFEEFLRPDNLEEFRAKYQNAVKLNKSDIGFEVDILKKDGQTACLEITSTPIMRQAEAIGMRGIIHDITERKKTEEEIKESRERLKMLNKIIRHDLGNDLAVINSAVNIFRKNSNPEMIDEIVARVKKSNHTIENYRSYEQFIDDNSHLYEIELSKLLKEKAQEYPKIKFAIKGKGSVFADETINSVFTNLISNSIKHGKSTQIEIDISEENTAITLIYRDNGSGIPPKIRDRIFEEGFFWGETGHTGIGLHIVEQTIQRFGGNIWAEENHPGGAKFMLKLRKGL